MKVIANRNSCIYGQPGIFRGEIVFDNPVLSGYTWSLCEIRGAKPGPTLCINAGIHVNEVSSIEAAIRIQQLIDPAKLAGTISIIPVVNVPGRFKYTEYVCPVDNKNIGYVFPGKEDGTFSEALAFALMNEWAKDADCWLDLHGGDMKENVGKFVFYQKDYGSEMEKRGRELARCFDANLIYGMSEEYMKQPYFTPAGCGSQGKLALSIESGYNGLLSEDCISFHVDGILNVLRVLGMIEGEQTPCHNAQIMCAGEYVRLVCPENGMLYSFVEPGDKVKKGQRVAIIKNLFGEQIAELIAPRNSIIAWKQTHPTCIKGWWLYGLVTPEEEPESKLSGNFNYAMHGLWV